MYFIFYIFYFSTSVGKLIFFVHFFNSKILKSTLIALLMLVGLSQINATIFVKAGANGNGTSWDNAFGTLTEALAHAKNGDQVWVAAGTYTPSVNADRHASFQIKDGIKVYGGFAGTETSLVQRATDLHKTILSGEIGQPGLADNSYNVVYFEKVSKNTVLDGFIITGGNANGEGEAAARNRCGGGIYNNGSNGASKPTIANCTLQKNAGRDGAAIYNNGRKGEASPTFTNCNFNFNEAGLDGGAMYNDGREKGISNPVLKNCTFASNMGTYGGAIFNATETGVCNLYLENCAFNDNSAYLRGGAVFNMNGVDKCVMELLDCSFTGNYPDDQSKVYTNNTARTKAYTIKQP